jgi:hypothetical protein
MKNLKNKRFIILVGVNLLILTLVIVFSILKINTLSYPSILHFDKIKGVDFLGDKTDFMTVNLLGIFLIILNYFLALKIFLKDQTTFYILASVNILISLLLFIFTIIIIYNN